MFLYLWTTAALAHPFDARWYGHRLDVQLQPELLRVDVAIEVPVVDLLSDMRREFEGVAQPGPDDLNAFNARLGAELRDSIRLIVDDQPARWGTATIAPEPAFENQFAVYTLQLEAALPPGSQTLNLINGTFPDQPSIFSTRVQVGGDVIVDACSLLEVSGGEVIESRDGQWRTEEDNRELRMSYRSRAGLDATLSRGLRTIAGEPTGLVSAKDAHSGVDRHEEPLQALIRGELTPLTIAWAFVLAVILGAFHAMSPGHGKTLVAAYLLGERQTIRHAIWLGIIVTITHTIGVYALGGLALLFEDSFPPEVLLPWMTLVSGVLVVGVGAALVFSRFRTATEPAPTAEAAHDHGHSHGHAHDHGHAHHHEAPRQHDHGHEHAHDHLDDAAHGSAHAHIYAEQADSWWGIVSLGVSGGLAPCPSALVLLLTAVSFHRTLLGLALIVAFSAGLAALVTAVGIGAVLMGDRLRQRGSGPAWLSAGLRWMPMASAALILLIGVGITVRGVGEILGAGG